MRKLAGPIVAVVFFAMAPAANAAISSVFNGDVSCSVQANGDRFCGNGSPRSTTKTFDDMPIDVNAAFPPAPSSGNDGPYPLIIIGHGYGGSKVGLGTMQPFLDQGFAVFSMTDRGFGESCGSSASQAADPTGCAAGYIRLMDDRYEVRDAQFFAGELVDQGLVEPTKIGATGPSYGGGLSMALAALKDRTMMPDGSLVPWKSPSGTAMSLAAAAPNIPWTDLAYSLQPNGSTLDYVKDAAYRGDPGVEKKSLLDGLYLLGCALHFCAPEGSNPEADVTGWKNRIEQGEPYVGDPTITHIVDELQAHHSSYGIDHSEPPAPLLISNGFTDDLFPVDEAIRYYNRTKTQYPKAPISLFFGDFGHPRAQNKPDVTSALSQAELAWLDYYVKGSGAKPFQGATAYTETCPSSAPSGGPFTAENWAKIAPGEVRLSLRKAQTIQPNAGDPSIGQAFDPVLHQSDPCVTAPGADQKGVASYRLPKAKGKGYTLLGSPTVIADFKSASPNSQVAARLLDVGPDGNETLVARGLWRPPTGKKPVEHVFQLHPGAWHFAAGHIPKLELLPNDAPYGRASDGQQAVTVSNLHLRLPVRDKPGTGGGVVGAPSPNVVPKGYKLASEFKGFGKTAMELTSKRLKTSGNKLPVGVKCPKAWVACDGVSIEVATSTGSSGDYSFGELGGRIKGGKSKIAHLRLPGLVRKYLGAHNSLKAKVTVGSTEQASPTVANAKIVSG
jgi:hypothetical protein